MICINGKKYYKVTEVAELAKVNTRTLRRWITDGNLNHFLFPYRQAKGLAVYYRLEPPDETDVLWEGESIYHFPEAEKPAAGRKEKFDESDRKPEYEREEDQ